MSTAPKFAVILLVGLGPLVTLAQEDRMPITTTSAEARALYDKALDSVENVEFEKARVLLDQAIQKDPGFAMAYALRAVTGGGYSVARQNRDSAASLAEKVSPAERQWIMAVQAQADGDVPRLKQVLGELVKLRPGDKHVAHFAGTMSLLVSDEEGSSHFKRAVTIDPEFAAPYNQLGYIALRRGDVPGAEQALKEYIAHRPDSPNPYDSYGELLLKTGRYDESITQYEKALVISPGFSSALAGIGHNHVFKGDYAKGREAYKRLSDAGDPPTRVNSAYWTAVSFVHEGTTAEALRALAQGGELATKERLTPAAMNAHLNQAWLLSELGKTTEALGHIAQIEKMLDGASLADRARANWRRQVLVARAMTAARAKDFTSAASTMARVKDAITPDLPSTATRQYEGTLGVIEVLGGNYDAALQHFKGAAPDDPYVMFYTAEARRLNGDVAGAAALYKKVATWNQNGLGYSLVRARAIAAATR